MNTLESKKNPDVIYRKEIFMRRVLSSVLAIKMILSLGVHAFAVESEPNRSEEYFRFTDPLSRMGSDGSFEFYCNSYLTSTHFVANSSQITVSASAKIYNRNTGVTSTSSKQFKITVCAVSGGDLSPVLTAKLNGKSESVTVNVTSGAEYYLIIESVSALDAVLYMKGSGSVSPVTVSNDRGI